jgi:CRP/FNR family transcriptional regulator
VAELGAAGTPARFRPGQIIFSEELAAGDLYLLRSGLVRLFHTAASGRDHILRDVGPVTVLGELSLDGTRTLSVSAAAVTETSMVRVPRGRVAALVERHPCLGLRLADVFSSELAHARRKTRDLALKDATARLSSILLAISEPGRGADPAYLPLRYRRGDLAAMIGASTETVIRMLTSLRAERVITTRGRQILILDRDRLRRLASAEGPQEGPMTTRRAS